MTSIDLKDRVALVTGGGSGIGRATCLAFAQAGAAVVVSDVTASEGEETAQLVARDGGRAEFVRADVSRVGDVEALVAQTVRRFGRLDCAFNNAGIGGTAAKIADYPDDDWERVIGVNLSGVRHCMKVEIQQMKQQGRGAIVNNASILGAVGLAGACAYVAAKHGVLGLTQVAALEYASRGVRVNAVCPGFVITPMLEKAGLTTDASKLHALESVHPIGRLGRPEEVATAVVWLCSDQASFVVGHSMFVDGGYVAQ